MPRAARPGGIELDWEERGEGPAVVLAHTCVSYPEVFHALCDDLAADHRLITYHPRGTGESTHAGPFDTETDAADLEAVIDDAGAASGILLGMGDGANRAVRVAARRPDLASHVVVGVGHTLGVAATKDTEALTESPSVLRALLMQLESDYRGALHTLIAVPNPNLGHEQVRARIDRTMEHVPQKAALGRMHHWIRDDATGPSRELGDRLWLLQVPDNPWFTPGVGARVHEKLPDAHVEVVDDGPISRPDICAGVVRRLTNQAGALSSDSQR